MFFYSSPVSEDCIIKIVISLINMTRRDSLPFLAIAFLVLSTFALLVSVAEAQDSCHALGGRCMDTNRGQWCDGLTETGRCHGDYNFICCFGSIRSK